MNLETDQRLGLINEIVHRQLLTSTRYPAGVYEFWGCDSTQSYSTNLKGQPSDWYWRDRKVTYTVNSQNYRAPEWHEIDWANSVALYGCSFVFGDGLSDKDTIAHQLSILIDRPVINLGAGGSGPLWQLHNQTLVKKWFGEPWATITIWPSASRCLSYDTDPHRWGSWNLKKDNWADLWNKGHNPGTQLWMCRELSQNMHQRTWVDATFNPNIAELLNIPCFKHYMESGPMARDLIHPGPETARATAAYLAEQLSLNPR